MEHGVRRDETGRCRCHPWFSPGSDTTLQTSECACKLSPLESTPDVGERTPVRLRSPRVARSTSYRVTSCLARAALDCTSTRTTRQDTGSARRRSIGLGLQFVQLGPRGRRLRRCTWQHCQSPSRHRREGSLLQVGCTHAGEPQAPLVTLSSLGTSVVLAGSTSWQMQVGYRHTSSLAPLSPAWHGLEELPDRSGAPGVF